MPKNASTIAQKWASRMSTAGDAMKAGVQAVNESPTAAAARAKDRWIQGVMQAAQDGAYEDGLNAVTKEEWQRKMINKGIPNMLNGAREAQSDVEKFFRDFQPFVESASAEVRAMPKGSAAEADARMLAMVNKLRQYKKRR